MVQLLFKGGDIVGKIKNYPIVVDLEDSTFVVETSAGTRKLEFQQIKEHLQKIINEGGMDGIKSTADKAMQTASEASNAANNAVDLIKDVIQNGDPFLITEKTTFYEESPASGCCNEVITSSGYLSGYPKGGRPWGWRGIEMLWGLDTVHIGGVVSKGKALYVTTDANADLSSIKSQDDLDADERLHKLSYSLPDNGYISELGFDQNYPWAAFPISTAATSQDGFCDELTSTGLITAVKEYSIATGLFEYNMHNRTNQCSCRFAYRKYS